MFGKKKQKNYQKMVKNRKNKEYMDLYEDFFEGDEIEDDSYYEDRETFAREQPDEADEEYTEEDEEYEEYVEEDEEYAEEYEEYVEEDEEYAEEYEEYVEEDEEYAEEYEEYAEEDEEYVEEYEEYVEEDEEYAEEYEEYAEEDETSDNYDDYDVDGGENDDYDVDGSEDDDYDYKMAKGRRKSATAYRRKPVSHVKAQKPKTVKSKSKRRIRLGAGLNLSGTDWIIAVMGICVLIVAMITGMLYADAKMVAVQVASFSTVGSELDDIDIIGESGLLAVGAVSEQKLLSEMEEPEEEIPEEAEEDKEEEDEEEEEIVSVVLKVTSIKSDIKVKFVNRTSEKLIGGVLFKIHVKGDNGKEFDLEDDDKDGIIYRMEIPNGTYKVSMEALSGTAAERYRLPAEAVSVKVTDMIEYKKVDVKEEIKNESQVNAAVEDTAIQDTVVESVLQDTVEWVESTKTPIESETVYEAVKDDDIAKPASAKAAIRNHYFMPYMGTALRVLTAEASGEKTAEEKPAEEKPAEEKPAEEKPTEEKPAEEKPTEEKPTEEKPAEEKPAEEKPAEEKPAGETPSTTGEKPVMSSGLFDAEIEVGGTIQLSASMSDGSAISWSSDSDHAGVDSTGLVTGKSAGKANITAKSDVTSETASCTITVVEKTEEQVPTSDATIKLDQSKATVKVGKSITLKATVDNNKDNKAIEWYSSDVEVAKVTDGTVTGVEKGTATIIATLTGTNISASCTVEVTEEDKPSISLDATEVDMTVGSELTLKATTENTTDKVVWSSSDKKVVKVEEGKLKALKEGDAVITAALESDSSIRASCTVTVTEGEVDTDAALKDTKGNQLYVKKKNGSYREAKVADYLKDKYTFYRKTTRDTAYRYTGWQTIDGYTYFYDKNGNYVTGEQVIQGAKYTFGADGRLSAGSGTMGIDVSKWNGDINWSAVKNSGVSFVIIRCGYRGSSTGAMIEDPKFRANIKGAKAAGLSVGVYFFTQAVNEVEAVEEASMVLSLIGGYGISLPVYLDVEGSGGRGDGIDTGMRTAVCKAFCATIQNSGYKAGIYANKTWLTSRINTTALTGYKIWLAQYAATPTYTATRYDMWQYSSKGKVSGISGNVDMNIKYN